MENQKIQKKPVYYFLLCQETIKKDNFLSSSDPVERLCFRKGVYDIISLTTRQLIIVNQRVRYPRQLENVIERKKKFAKIDRVRSINKISEGLFDIGFVSQKKAVLIDLGNREVVRISREMSAVEAISFKRKIETLEKHCLLGDSPLEVWHRGDVLISAERYHGGLPFGALSKAYRIDVVKELLSRNGSIDCINDFAHYGELKSWYNTRRLEIDRRYRRLFDSIFTKGAIPDVVNWLVLSHRDLTEHNTVYLDNRLVYVDLSPFKIGLAPWWYDPLTLIQTEGSEYGRYDLLEVFLRGGFDRHLGNIIPPNFENKSPRFQVRYRLDILLVGCLLMLFYPFKIKPDRVTSWLSGTYCLFRRITSEKKSELT